MLFEATEAVTEELDISLYLLGANRAMEGL